MYVCVRVCCDRASVEPSILIFLLLFLFGYCCWYCFSAACVAVAVVSVDFCFFFLVIFLCFMCVLHSRNNITDLNLTFGDKHLHTVCACMYVLILIFLCVCLPLLLCAKIILMTNNIRKYGLIKSNCNDHKLNCIKVIYTEQMPVKLHSDLQFVSSFVSWILFYLSS